MQGLEIDPLLAKKIIDVLTGRAQSEISMLPPVITSMAYNLNSGFPSGTVYQKTFHVHYEQVTAADTNADLYNVTTGKTLWITAIEISGSSGSPAFRIGDGTATATATMMYEILASTSVVQRIFPTPLKFSNKVTIQTSAIQNPCYVTLHGWEE